MPARLPRTVVASAECVATVLIVFGRSTWLNGRKLIAQQRAVNGAKTARPDWGYFVTTRRPTSPATAFAVVAGGAAKRRLEGWCWAPYPRPSFEARFART